MVNNTACIVVARPAPAAPPPSMVVDDTRTVLALDVKDVNVGLSDSDRRLIAELVRVNADGNVTERKLDLKDMFDEAHARKSVPSSAMQTIFRASRIVKSQNGTATAADTLLVVVPINASGTSDDSRQRLAWECGMAVFDNSNVGRIPALKKAMDVQLRELSTAISKTLFVLDPSGIVHAMRYLVARDFADDADVTGIETFAPFDCDGCFFTCNPFHKNSYARQRSGHAQTPDELLKTVREASHTDTDTVLAPVSDFAFAGDEPAIKLARKLVQLWKDGPAENTKVTWLHFAFAPTAPNSGLRNSAMEGGFSGVRETIDGGLDLMGLVVLCMRMFCPRRGAASEGKDKNKNKSKNEQTEQSPKPRRRSNRTRSEARSAEAVMAKP